MLRVIFIVNLNEFQMTFTILYVSYSQESFSGWCNSNLTAYDGTIYRGNGSSFKESGKRRGFDDRNRIGSHLTSGWWWL